MTETQLTEIRQYLLSKKLPIDILIEINDHFISQITDLQKEENLGFEEAFEEVKENWQEDLETRYPWYVLNKTEYVRTTKFENKIRKIQNIDFLKKAFIFSTIIFSVIFLLYFLFLSDSLLKKTILYLFIGVMLFAVGTVFYNLLFNQFAYKKKYISYRFSVFQWRSFMIFPLANLITSYMGGKSTLNQLFLNLINHPDIKTSFHFILFFFLITGLIYTGIVQLRCAKILKKVKFFIKYL